MEVKEEALGLYELLEERIESGLVEVLVVNEPDDKSSEGTWVDSVIVWLASIYGVGC